MHHWIIAAVFGLFLILVAGMTHQANAEGGSAATGAANAGDGVAGGEGVGGLAELGKAAKLLMESNKIQVDEATLKQYIERYDQVIEGVEQEMEKLAKAYHAYAEGSAWLHMYVTGRAYWEFDDYLFGLIHERNYLKRKLSELQARKKEKVGDGCFDPETRVVMADGRLREIYRVKEGDLVKTFNLQKGVVENKKVLKTYAFPAKGYYLINDSLKATAKHKFLMAGPEVVWKEAAELKKGDKIKAADGFINVESIEWVAGIDTSYNFRVAENQAYIVSEGGHQYVVHNGD
jgi:hypothetical protein